MAKSINQTILMGRITKDPEETSTKSGKSLVNFTLAVDKGNEQAAFFDITAWDKLAEIVCKYTGKGSKILVQGRLDQQVWEKDGRKNSKVVIVATDITFLDSKNTESSNRNLSQKEVLDHVLTEEEENKPIDLSEIPF